MTEKKKHTKRTKKVILNILIAACLVIMGISGYRLGKEYWKLFNSKQHDNAVKAIAQASADPNKRWTPDITTYQTMHSRNSDYVGWILWDSDIISEPIVQGLTNDTYLRHNFDHQYDVFGAIFMDSSNQLTDDNIMIYGHSLAGNKAATQMFSPLQNITDQAFLDANSSFKIYWEDHISSYEIVSATLMDTSLDDWNYQQPVFANADAKKEWISEAISHSQVKAHTTADENDKFVTLQTCHDTWSSDRYVIVAREVNELHYNSLG